MANNKKNPEPNGAVTEQLLYKLARLRVIVGYLGEADQYHWWASNFFASTSSTFLSPVFAKTPMLAQYNGVKEAARRVHDEHIGIGRVFHLFRLPESIEQTVFDLLHEEETTASLGKDVESQDVASSALLEMAGSAGSLQEGPMQMGTTADFADVRWLADTARCYLAAFEAGLRSYPYFKDQV